MRVLDPRETTPPSPGRLVFHNGTHCAVTNATAAELAASCSLVDAVNYCSPALAADSSPALPCSLPPGEEEGAFAPPRNRQPDSSGSGEVFANPALLLSLALVTGVLS